LTQLLATENYNFLKQKAFLPPFSSSPPAALIPSFSISSTTSKAISPSLSTPF
jgi:hypothetical protein